MEIERSRSYGAANHAPHGRVLHPVTVRPAQGSPISGTIHNPPPPPWVYAAVGSCARLCWVARPIKSNRPTPCEKIDESRSCARPSPRRNPGVVAHAAPIHRSMGRSPDEPGLRAHTYGYTHPRTGKPASSRYYVGTRALRTCPWSSSHFFEMSVT